MLHLQRSSRAWMSVRKLQMDSCVHFAWFGLKLVDAAIYALDLAPNVSSKRGLRRQLDGARTCLTRLALSGTQGHPLKFLMMVTRDSRSFSDRVKVVLQVGCWLDPPRSSGPPRRTRQISQPIKDASASSDSDAAAASSAVCGMHALHFFVAQRRNRNAAQRSLQALCQFVENPELQPLDKALGSEQGSASTANHSSQRGMPGRRLSRTSVRAYKPSATG